VTSWGVKEDTGGLGGISGSLSIRQTPAPPQAPRLLRKPKKEEKPTAKPEPEEAENYFAKTDEKIASREFAETGS